MYLQNVKNENASHIDKRNLKNKKKLIKTGILFLKKTYRDTGIDLPYNTPNNCYIN